MIKPCPGPEVEFCLKENYSFRAGPGIADPTQVVYPRRLQVIDWRSIPSGDRILDLGYGMGE
jgi:hypothetical protein